MQAQDFPMQAMTRNADETFAYASRMAVLLKPGDLILLKGPLGAGKTHFVRGLCWGLGLKEIWEVDSPTYTVVNHYDVGPGVDHIDLYRFEHGGDLDEIGFDEILADSSIKLVEWPERLGGYPIPQPAYTISFEIKGEQRMIRVSSDLS